MHHDDHALDEMRALLAAAGAATPPSREALREELYALLYDLLAPRGPEEEERREVWRSLREEEPRHARLRDAYRAVAAAEDPIALAAKDFAEVFAGLSTAMRVAWARRDRRREG